MNPDFDKPKAERKDVCLKAQHHADVVLSVLCRFRNRLIKGLLLQGYQSNVLNGPILYRGAECGAITAQWSSSDMGRWRDNN